jgi:hypothetical protein
MSKLLLECDSAYALDYLSILQVKALKLQRKELYKSFDDCFNQLQKQVGKLKFNDIFNSQEYKDLLAANMQTFDSVEKVRTNKPITAKEVDDLNMLRFKAKAALQEKFFNTTVVEFKT